MNSLAHLALQEWQTRFAFAQRMANERRWSREEADARLYPWLALALHCGATPPEAEPEVERHRQAGLDDRHARTVVRENLCPMEDLRAELTRARDAAMARAATDRARAEQSHRLQCIAAYLRCDPPPPAHPGEPQHAASRRAAEPESLSRAQPKEIAA